MIMEYFIRSQNDILKGYALIIGPKDTVYDSGCYIFNFIIQLIILSNHQR